MIAHTHTHTHTHTVVHRPEFKVSSSVRPVDHHISALGAGGFAIATAKADYFAGGSLAGAKVLILLILGSSRCLELEVEVLMLLARDDLVGKGMEPSVVCSTGSHCYHFLSALLRARPPQVRWNVKATSGYYSPPGWVGYTFQVCAAVR